jgi:hypothetical protein
VAKYDPTHLPPSFYEQTPLYGLIARKAAHVGTGPDAVLLASLARVAAAIAPDVSIDYGNGNLNVFAAIVGPPGAGKSKATRAACDLLPNVGIENDRIPVPTGEGLCGLYLAVKPDDTGLRPIVKRTAFVLLDEGAILLQTARREGATILSIARQLWSAADAGTFPDDPARRRVIPAGSVRLCIAVNFQPDVARTMLDMANVGDPQRFLWASCLNPYAERVRPPDLPRIDWQPDNTPRRLKVPGVIRDGIIAHETEVSTGRLEVDPLDVRDVEYQLRIAAVLTLFHDPSAGEIALETWNHAGEIVEMSRTNRQRLVEYARAAADEKRREKNAETIASEKERRKARTDDERIEKVATNLRPTIQRKGGQMTKGDLSQHFRRDRDFLDAAIAIAVERGEIVEQPTERGRLFVAT